MLFREGDVLDTACGCGEGEDSVFIGERYFFFYEAFCKLDSRFGLFGLSFLSLCYFCCEGFILS